jgi:iron(III) transport system substrate-binding protein
MRRLLRTRPRRGLGLTTRVAAFGTTALLTASVLGGCGSSPPANALTLYNGQHPQTTQALVNAFEQATGIDVVVRSDDEDLLANEIVTDGCHSPADVILSENSPALQYLDSQHVLAKLPSTTLARTPSQFNSPVGDWVGVSARVSVIIYNPSLIKADQLPTSVLQLADPRYKGEVAFAPSESDVQPIVTAVLHAYGRARTLSWLAGVSANASGHEYPDNEALTNEVNRGAVAFGVINQYYWYRLRAELGASAMHSELAFFAPHDPGYVLNVSGAGVLRCSSHAAEAQRLVDFLVSRQGQEIIAHSTSFEYPIASGVTTAALEKPFNELEPYPITIAELGDGSQAIALLREAGLL